MLLRHVTFDCADPYALATFWSAVTGWPVSDEDAPGDDEVLVEAPAPVPGLLFIRVPEAKTVKNRVHFDLRAPGSIPDEVARLRGLGASVLREGDDLVVMQDPEGNEFCVE